MESKLHDLIEEGGQDVLNDLATKSQQTRTAIDTRYAQFTELMDQKFGAFQTTANNLFAQFATQRQQLEQELTQAIAQNNNTRAQEIQQFINDVKAMEQSVQGGVQQINALQSEYASLFAQADQLMDLEQRMQTQSQRYDTMLAELSAKLQDAETKYEAQKETDLSTLSAAEIQAYKDKLAAMSAKFTQMQQALQNLQDMYDDAEKIVQELSDLADDADGLASLLSDISDAYDNYSTAEDILNRIDAIDVSNYESLYDDLKSQLEQAHAEMGAAASGLTNVKESLESTRDDLIQWAADCEFNADYAETVAQEIQDEFNEIPFP